MTPIETAMEWLLREGCRHSGVDQRRDCGLCLNEGVKMAVELMREECAKVAASYAEDIPDADQRVFHDLGEKIRLVGTNQ